MARLKKLSVALLGQASATYGDGLKSEQEVLAQIADVIIETYATESGIARADKIAARGGAHAGIATDIARVYANAVEMIGDEEKAVEWLRTPNRALGGDRPLDQLGTDLGARAVEDILGRIAYGVYS